MERVMIYKNKSSRALKRLTFYLINRRASKTDCERKEGKTLKERVLEQRNSNISCKPL